ncbi:MAG: Trk family potassium uptake protein [Thermomicrobiales bacterium]|nr:Trk family potassium uptake protein [Thermomicrobiales bacterium]
MEPPSANRHALRFVLALLTIIMLGSVLLVLPISAASGHPTRLDDAFFTAVSAAAVNGLMVVDTADHWSIFGEVVILLLIQIGGLGFAVGASLLLLMLRRGQSSSLRDQMLLRDGVPSLSLREAGDLTGHIVRYTLVVEACGALLLAIRFAADMPVPTALWQGLFHAISAYCNAGFDLQGHFTSMTPYRESVWINVVIMALVQAGALGYLAVHAALTHRRWQPLPLDAKLVLLTNAVLLIGAAALFLAIEWDGVLAAAPPWARPMTALFQSASARTAGFSTIAWNEAHPITLYLWLGVMMVGGAAGSTAGGVKLATAGVIVAVVASTLAGRTIAHVFGRRLAPSLVARALTVVASFMALHFALSALLALTEDRFGLGDLSFISLTFEMMSALSTAGISTGITPALTMAGKLVLCAAMIAGRIGPLTLAYALQRRQRTVRYKFPEESVRIG